MKAFGRLLRFHIRRFVTDMMETSLRRRVELIEGIGILMGPVIWSLAPRLALSAVTVDASESKKRIML